MASNEAEENYRAYESDYKEEMEREHPGKFALMHKKEIIHILNDFEDAYSIGETTYELGNFSIVEIGKRPTRLSRRAIGVGLA